MDQREHPEESIEGTLDHILYGNESSGYSVAVLECDVPNGVRKRITVVGELGSVEVGAGIRARGRVEKHPRYGEQFRVLDYETIRAAGGAALACAPASAQKVLVAAIARRAIPRGCAS